MKMNTKKSDLQFPAVERRKHARVTLAPPLVGRLVGGGEPFGVEEASVSGFSMTSSTPSEPGVAYRFRLSNETGHVAIVQAVCRSCTALATGDEPKTYRAGFELLPQSTRRLRLIIGAIAMNAP